MPPTHEMIRVDGIWECLECPRRLLFTDTRRLVVLAQGNVDAQHFGSVGGAGQIKLRIERNT